MCKYCNTLASLRREDRRHFDSVESRYNRWFKEDLMLLRECLIVLDWKSNRDLVERICKQLYVEEE